MTPASDSPRPQHVEALTILPSAITIPHAQRIVEHAARSRLPAMYGHPVFTDAGGLMSYAHHLPDQYRRAAALVDRILKGANPADLPVERPMRFDFIVNLQTAQALGLTIPEHVLLQATEVLQ